MSTTLNLSPKRVRRRGSGSRKDLRIENKKQLDANSYVRLRSYHTPLAQEVVKHLKLDPTKKLLDIGTGPGQALGMWIVLSGVDAQAVDLDPGRAEYAEKNLLEKVPVHCANVLELPFEDNSFDRVTSQFSFHRFRDRAGALGEIRRILKPDGQFAIIAPTPDQLGQFLEFRFFEKALRLEQGRFERSWGEELRDLVLDAGFSQLEEIDCDWVDGLADSSWIDWVSRQPFSAHQELTPDEFQNGLDAMKQFLHSQPSMTAVRYSSRINIAS